MRQIILPIGRDTDYTNLEHGKSMTNIGKLRVENRSVRRSDHGLSKPRKNRVK